ncbi:hypothetical protein [Acinetobacter schindleri]|uniref:hypothetical protein n=2 Tax=Acinetobacter TaxID=469 RepID=UPI00241FF438|nr:hypothetical protein [Acinetobacter schindleri]
MEQENNNEAMIQLPWTVPQQPLVQTASVVENPSRKMELDLNHSTDTTAIWSFIIAMVIAFILGVSATIIAIWYGRKSFDLTKQSFDALILQIQSAEKITQLSNIKLIENQNDLLMKNNEIASANKKYDDLKQACINYISQHETYRMHLMLLQITHKEFKFSERSEIGSYQSQIFEDLRNRLKLILDAKTRLRFLIYHWKNDTTLTGIIFHIHELDKLALKLQSYLSKNEYENFDRVMEQYKQYVLDVEVTLIRMLN